MKVILEKDHPTLGKMGQVVSVKDGYARNFLIPKGIAIEATPSAIKNWQAKKTFSQLKESADLEKAREIYTALEGKRILIQAEAGQKGKLFGSVTPQAIVQVIKEQYGYELDRKLISNFEPIRAIGTHKVPIKFKGNLVLELEVEVIPKE